MYIGIPSIIKRCTMCHLTKLIKNFAFGYNGAASTANIPLRFRIVFTQDAFSDIIRSIHPCRDPNDKNVPVIHLLNRCARQVVRIYFIIESYHVLHDSINRFGGKPLHGTQSHTLGLLYSYDNIATPNIVKIIGKSAYSMIDRVGIPSGLELYSVSFYLLFAQQILNIYG